MGNPEINMTAARMTMDILENTRSRLDLCIKENPDIGNDIRILREQINRDIGGLSGAWSSALQEQQQFLIETYCPMTVPADAPSTYEKEAEDA